MTTDQGPTPPGPQVTTATLTTATTALVLWAVGDLFHGEVPGAVSGFLILAVPAAMGRLSAQLAYRRQKNHHDGL